MLYQNSWNVQGQFFVVKQLNLNWKGWNGVNFSVSIIEEYIKNVMDEGQVYVEVNKFEYIGKRLQLNKI